MTALSVSSSSVSSSSLCLQKATFCFNKKFPPSSIFRVFGHSIKIMKSEVLKCEWSSTGSKVTGEIVQKHSLE